MSRFYIVKNKSEDGAYCIVEANTRGAALQRAAAHYCTVEIATPRDVLDAMKWERDVIEIKAGEQQDLPLNEAPEPFPSAVAINAEDLMGKPEDGEII